MVNGSGVSHGDRNRNTLLARLPELVPRGNAIVGIDLADRKQMVVVTDHDQRCWPAERSGARSGTWRSRWTGTPAGLRPTASPVSRSAASRPGHPCPMTKAGRGVRVAGKGRRRPILRDA